MTLPGGSSSRSNGLLLSHSTWRSINYQPYGGDGIYRGQINITSVGAFDISPNGSSSQFRRLTPVGWEGGLGGLRLGLLRRAGEIMLMGGSWMGGLFVIPTNGTDGGAPVPVPDTATGVLFSAAVIGASPIGYPIPHAGHRNPNGSGDIDDLIIGGENGLHFVQTMPAIVASSGQKLHARLEVGDHVPILGVRHVGPVLEAGAALVTGGTPTVSVTDWDGDGAADIIAGSSEGRIFFAAGVRVDNKTVGFTRPTALKVGDSDQSLEILVQGGYREDIQGPAENRWGYTAPVAVDWDDDGLVDLVSSDNSARVTVYMRYRTARGSLALRPGVPLRLDGLELHGTWRNGPACARIRGRMVLITSDEQDEAHLYYRIDNYNLEDGGKLLVRTPAGGLQPIQTNYLHAGGTGRLKYSLADLDSDGTLELLLGTCGYHSIPSNITGLPACSPDVGAASSNGRCRNNGATVLVMRMEDVAKPIGSTVARPRLIFDWPQWLTVRGFRIAFGGQELGISPFEDTAFNNEPGLLLATPGGRHIFWATNDLGTSSVEPPLQPHVKDDTPLHHQLSL